MILAFGSHGIADQLGEYPSGGENLKHSDKAGREHLTGQVETATSRPSGEVCPC